MHAKELLDGMSDESLVQITREAIDLAHKRRLPIPEFMGSLAIDGAQPESAIKTPEAPVISREGLLSTLDIALTTFGSQVDVVNRERSKLRGQRKPEQLKTVDQAVIRGKVITLISNHAVLAELPAQANYFTANPEADSPAAGFDILIVPEGLTDTDEEAIARDLKANSYIRPKLYNDKRAPEITGKGFRIAFAPRHYNVPSGTATTQTKWMEVANTKTTATQLQTATDAEALAQIHNLELTGALDDPNTRFHTSYFRCFDQAPVVGSVSYVRVFDSGKFFLSKSDIRGDYSTRALVVPKA